MKNKKVIIIFFAILTIIIGGVFAFIKNIRPSYAAAPTSTPVESTYTISSEYAFMPRFYGNNTTYVVTNYTGAIQEQRDSWAIPLYKVTPALASSGNIYVIYKNVGKYKGQIVDMKITLTGVEYLDDKNDAYLSYWVNGIGIYARSIPGSRKKFKIEYYKHRANTDNNYTPSDKLSIPNILVFGDIDGPNNAGNAEEVGFYGFNDTLYFREFSPNPNNPNSSHFTISTVGDWKYYTGTCAYTLDATSLSQDGQKCEVDVVSGIHANPNYKAGYVASLGNGVNQQISWKGYFIGTAPSPWRIKDPAPIKYVDKTNNVYIGDDLTYTIEQYVPNQSEEFYYSSWRIEDTVPTGTEYNSGSIIIKDAANQNRASWFDVSYTNGKLTISAKSSTLTNPDFYNNTYDISFKVKLTTNTNIKENEAKLLNNYNTITSNKVSTTPKVKVKYELVGDVPSGSPAVPGEEQFDLNSSYNQKPKLPDGIYGERGDICHFEGWNTNKDGTTLSGTWTDGTKLTKDTTLYGKWNCKDRWKDPEKEEDKEVIKLDEEITYKITNEVPKLTEEEMSLFKYTSYEITDNLDKIFGQVGVNVYRNEVNGHNNVRELFDISINNNKVSIKAKAATLNDISFYGNKYIVVIKAKISDDYAVNSEKILDEYKTKKIENVATLKIDDKPEWTKDTNKVEAEIEKVKIKYRIIGEGPDKELTDDVPEDSEQAKGTSYTQEGPLTTRDKTKICTFNGWYSNEEFTNKWKDGESLSDDLNLYGSWDCSELINPLRKTTDDIKTKIGEEYEYKLYNTVPKLDSDQYYKSYIVEDELESVVKIESEEKIRVNEIEIVEENGETEEKRTDVTEKFEITIEGQKIKVKAKDVTDENFYGKRYEFIFRVTIPKGQDLSKYKKDKSYIIPNKAKLNIVPKNGEERCIEEECSCDGDNCYEQETEEVEKELKPATIIYKVIGPYFPDPNKTDKTPEKEELLQGSKYDAKKGLTTRDESKICTFKGWYTDKELNKAYKNGTEVYDDLELFGKWECTEKIKSPDTKSNNILPLIIGILSIVVGIILYTNRKKLLSK